MWDTCSVPGSLCKVDQFICEFYRLKCIYDKLYIVNLFMVQTNLKRNNEQSKSLKKKKRIYEVDVLCLYVCVFFPPVMYPDGCCASL